MKRSEYIKFLVEKTLDQDFSQKDWMYEEPLEKVAEDLILKPLEKLFDLPWEPENED